MSDVEHRLRVNLGEQLRSLREHRGMSRDELAGRCKLDAQALAAFEEGREAPAIGELARIAPVLRVDLGSFFVRRPAGGARVEIVRAEQRWDVEPKTDTARALNYRYQALSYSLSDKAMFPFLVEIPPASTGEVTPSRHAGEEFLFVLEGQLEFELGGERHRLGPGDSVYFDSSAEHTLRAVEGTAVRLVACVAHAPARSPGNDLERAFGRS